MLHKKSLLLSLVALSLSVPLFADVPSWFDKFQSERAKAFGPLSEHSTQEAKQFLLLEGRPPVAVPKPAVVSEPPVAPALVPEETEPAPLPEKPRKTKRSVRRKTTDRVPVEAMLERAQRAHAQGRLEDAKRYYTLVKRADPNSVEAAEKLEQLKKEME